MIGVVQRVSEASVTINGAVEGKIGTGIMLLLGIEEADTQEDIEWLSRKIVNLRIFNDDDGVMNRSLAEVGGDILLISRLQADLQREIETGEFGADMKVALVNDGPVTIIIDTKNKA